MLQKIFLTLSLISLNLSCASGPRLTVYVSDPAKGGMEFSGKTKGFVVYADTDKFTCLEPSDLTTLLDYCREAHEHARASWQMFAAGPELTIFISNPGMGGMDFHNPRTGTSGFLDYSLTDKFTCLTPTDTQTLLNYCGGMPQLRSQIE